MTEKPTISVGSVGLDSEFMALFLEGKGAGIANIDGLIEKLEGGEFDLVAIGRGLLADPIWVSKIREGRIDELTPFSSDAVKTLH